MRAESRSGAPPLVVWLFAAVGVLAFWVWWSSGPEAPEPTAPLASVETAAESPAPGTAESRSETSAREPQASQEETREWEEWQEWTSAPASPAEPAPTRPPVTTTAWHEGAEGYRRAIEEQAGTHQPMVVYFYTDWCGYCRELERELLERYEVEDFLRDVIKVRINPEKGAAERQVSDGFGVRSYPSFFAKGYGGSFLRVQRRTFDPTRGARLQTPDEFVETLRKATASGRG